LKKYYIECLNKCLSKILKDKSVYIIGEDIQEPYGGAFKVTKGLSALYPDQIIYTPMSEQGFTGMAVGMALAGLKPIVEIMFGDFITLTVDQLINHASKFKGLYNQNMHLVVRTPMGGYRGYGATHSQSLEKLFFGIPEIFVIAPSVADDPGILLEKSINYGYPIVFVENKLDYTQALLEEWDKYYLIKKTDDYFPIYSVFYEEEISDLTVICYGGLVKNAATLQKDIYMEEEISIKIIVPSQISPAPTNQLYNLIKEDARVLIIEEGHTPFGWGDTILSQLYQLGVKAEMRTIGSKNKVICAAKNLEEEILPNFQLIKKMIIDWIQ
jgi:pyruvate/2-oxoglutarate/acetoin dehydrogenase E1 component